MLSSYIDCLTAATPLLAQIAGDEGQRAIDAVTDALEIANARTSVMEELERGNLLDEGGLNLLDALAQLSPGKTLLELDREGSNELASITGRDKFNPGIGTSHLVLKVLAAHHLDPETYQRKLVLGGRLLQSRRTDMADIMQDLDFHRDMAAARSRSLRLNVILDRALSQGLPEPMLIDQLMDLYREALEHFGLPLIAFTLRLTGRKSASYGRLRTQDVSALAKYCEDHSDAATLIGGYSKAIRHAASHAGAYRYSEGVIHIELRSEQVTIELDDFVDKMFEFLESAQALMLLAEAELLPSAGPANATSLFMDGVAYEKQTEFILRSCGVSTVSKVVSVGDTWHAEITHDGPGLLLLCRSIAAWCPPQARYVRITTDGGRRYVEAPLSNLRASLEAQMDTASDFLALLHGAEGPNGPLLTTEMLRHLSFAVAAKAKADAAGFRELKAVRTAAQRHGDEELARALKAAMVRLRLGDEALKATDERKDFALFAQLRTRTEVEIP